MKGTIKIRKGNKNQEPAVVYITGKNTWDYWVCHSLNTGYTFLADTEDLLDFDYILFKKMLLGWRISQTRRTEKRLRKDIKKLQNMGN